MKRFIIITLLISVSSLVFAKINIDSLLNELNKEITKRDIYIEDKYKNINHLTDELKNKENNKNLSLQFDNYLSLYNEYKSFIYDSAFTYAMKVQQTAYLLNDRNKIIISKLNLSFILTSSGMFKEAFDTLQTINNAKIPDSILFDYYALMTRAYFDIIAYNGNVFYTAIYENILNHYIDSTINLSKKNSQNYLYYTGLKNIENGNVDQAQSIYEDLLSNYKPDYHLYAMVASGLAYVYLSKGQTDNAIKMLAEAVKADIKSATKETVAAHKLAEILYEKGYVKEAYFYIKLAMDDASFYKTNLRKKQIYTILPVIEGHELSTTESHKQILFRYSIATTLLSILVVIFLIVTYRNLKELRIAKKINIEANNKLLESNKIKDEYIGYYFNVTSEYIDKIEKFKKAINRKLATKRIDDIEAIIQNINSQKEKEDLFTNFDKVFVKLFPDFVSHFNALLKEDEKIHLKDNQILNTDLRIFALIRIGINDHEKISKILGYSVSTIYNYKTRIRKKSLVPNDEFEQKVMEIKPI